MTNRVSPVEVTVVIPTRDRGHLLPRSLRSALAQRDVTLEVVVVDDGSVPPAAHNKVVARVCATDARVRVLRHMTPKGVSAARNSGIEAATGRWIAFLDDDDIWAPQKLASQLAALNGRTRLLVELDRRGDTRQ